MFVLEKASSDDGFFGFAVEEVGVGHQKSKFDVLTDGQLAVGVDTGNEAGGGAGEVHIGFGTHGFDHFHFGLDFGHLGIAFGRFITDIFGTDTEGDFLVAEGFHLFLPGIGHRAFETGRGEEKFAVLADQSTFEEVHRRSADEAGNELVAGLVVQFDRSSNLLVQRLPAAAAVPSADEHP